MLFYAIISSVVYLRCRMQFSAKPMNKKRFWSCLLLQMVYRLNFSFSKRGLATFASDKRR